MHLGLMAMAGGLGMEIDLSCLPVPQEFGNDLSAGICDEALLFSESAGRFILTVAKDNREVFEKLCKGFPVSCVGVVTDHNCLKINGKDKKSIVNLSCDALDTAFNKTFGEMI